MGPTRHGEQDDFLALPLLACIVFLGTTAHGWVRLGDRGPSAEFALAESLCSRTLLTCDGAGVTADVGIDKACNTYSNLTPSGNESPT